MSAVRQDAWSAEDDLILAEVTLRHIREGSTQLAAFEEVGERIGRTSAACGFRWNSCVRKKYEDAISLAKSQRQKRSYYKNSLPLADLKLQAWQPRKWSTMFIKMMAQAKRRCPSMRLSVSFASGRAGCRKVHASTNCLRRICVKKRKSLQGSAARINGC